MESIESLQDQNSEKHSIVHLRELIQEILFGESSSGWRALQSQELEDFVNGEPDQIVEKYLGQYYEGMSEDRNAIVINEKLAEFSEKVYRYKDVLKKNVMYPAFYIDAFHDWFFDANILNDEKSISDYIWNYNLRFKDKAVDGPKRMKERLEREPLGNAEECNAGVYREDLEYQVSDAVFLLRQKGYSTFESGFMELIDGSQYIGFNRDNEDSIRQYLSLPASSELFNSEKIEATLETRRDRAMLVLKPESRQKTMEYWKTVWDKIAQSIPDRGKSAEPPFNLGSYGTFMKRQLKIRNGEKT